MSLIYRPMREGDLDHVVAIEREICAFPWSRGNFRDSIAAGYHCLVAESEDSMLGYGVMMKSLDEVHLLNLGVARERQGRGYGRKLLQHLVDTARRDAARYLYLEVRASNQTAFGLYRSFGLSQIAVRRNYYPASEGREDALIMGGEI